MKSAAGSVLLSVFLRGSLARGEAASLTGYSDRAGRDIERQESYQSCVILQILSDPISHPVSIVSSSSTPSFAGEFTRLDT